MILSGCVTHVGAMSGPVNTWGHVRRLGGGAVTAEASVVSLVPIMMFVECWAMLGCSEDMSRCWACCVMLDASKHTESCGLCLCSILCCSLVWFPPPHTPSTFPVLLAPFCYGWLGGECRFLVRILPPPPKAPSLPPRPWGEDTNSPHSCQLPSHQGRDLL